MTPLFVSRVSTHAETAESYSRHGKHCNDIFPQHARLRWISEQPPSAYDKSHQIYLTVVSLTLHVQGTRRGCSLCRRSTWASICREQTEPPCIFCGPGSYPQTPAASGILGQTTPQQATLGYRGVALSRRGECRFSDCPASHRET